jgi:Bacterial PH domain
MKQALSDTKNIDMMLSRAGVTLTADEKIIATTKIHDAIYWKSVAVILMGMLMLPWFLQNLGFLLIFVGLVMLGLAYMAQTFLILTATDKRIFVRSGYVYTDMVELRYTQVESIEVGITPIGQVWGYGSIIVSGTGQRRIIVPFVKDAIEFRRRVNDILVNK